ncbi:ABC transporter substrate-binding protein [soil metagenome]
MRHKRFLGLSSLLVTLAMVAAACGGGGGGGGESQGANAGAGSGSVFGGTKVTQGGTMKWASIGDVDYMDPGQAYTVTYFAYLNRGVLRTLMTYPGVTDPAEQIKVIPDLAESAGKPNSDFTQWTYKIKDGVKFGPALGGQKVPGVTGEEITSEDIKYAIERLAFPSVGAGYATYYEDTEGTEEFVSANAKGGPIKGEISGIETPDDKTIVFNLSQPVGDWDYRMSMPATAPVPQEFAQKYDSTKDSDYDSHILSSGPYYVDEWTPQESMVLKRNTEWDQATDDARDAVVDSVQWKQGFGDDQICVQKVLSNDYDTAVDCSPEGAQLKEVVTNSDYNQRFFNEVEPCTGYIFINTTVPPLDDPKVRQAINYATDKANQIKLLGGPYVGAVGTSILPPGMQGSLPPSEFDPFPQPGGQPNIEAANKLITEAGLGGGYACPKLLLVGDASGAGPKQVESFQADLEKIGFPRSSFDVRTLNYPDYYTQFYEDPTSDTAFGFSAWCEDFPSPTTFLTPLLYGPNILKSGNSNYSELDDPELNSLIEKAQESTGSDATAAWEAANKKATELAPWVPYRWYKSRTLASDRMENAYFHAYYENLDWINSGVGG